MEEKTVSSREVFQGPFFSIREDDIVYPDGEKRRRLILQHPGAVAALAVLPDDRLLLVRQYRKAVERETLEIPAGKIEAGETPEDCLARELAEETGYRARSFLPLISYYPSLGISTEIIHVYLARDLDPLPGPFSAPEHSLDRVILPLKEVEQKIEAGEIRDSKTIIAVRELAERRRKKKSGPKDQVSIPK